MKYEVSFNITKGYAEIKVEAENKEEAEDIAWQELSNMFVGELRKLEVEMDTDEMCHGTGEIKQQTCSECNGWGEVVGPDAGDDGHVWITCNKCNGTGKVYK